MPSKALDKWASSFQPSGSDSDDGRGSASDAPVRFRLPKHHKPVLVADDFSCSACKFFNRDGDKLKCASPDYQAFMGTNELVNPATGKKVTDPTKMCSDWFEEK
jgi:hypothetical protein